ncbi:RsiV family protein [Pectobacterium carotovorum]|uniref:DUF3298 and DUF4163 domain-containing protein n=1 Tax=Pectobacterium carotovorum TaxID=554 RepID=UPI003016AD7B
MDISLLKAILSAPELSVAAIGAMLIIFRNIIRAKFLARLTQEHSYKIINRIIWFVGVVTIVGALSWWSIRLYEIHINEGVQEKFSQDQSDKPVLKTKVLDKRIPDNQPGTNVSMAEIHLEYPEISGLKDKLIEKKINEHIKEMIGVNQQFDGRENLYMEISDASIDGDLLSVLAMGTFYAHDAAGAINQIVSINANVKNGEVVQFKDLFRAGYQEKINNLVNSWLSTKDYTSFFEGVKDDQCFYFNGNYLYLCFSEYEIAPGSEGIVNVPIKLDDIRGFISRNGPLAYFI